MTVVSLVERREERRHIRAHHAMIRVRNVPEPLRSMRDEAERVAKERDYAGCNAYRSYYEAS